LKVHFGGDGKRKKKTRRNQNRKSSRKSEGIAMEKRKMYLSASDT
jgi:hypothetical protein